MRVAPFLAAGALVAGVALVADAVARGSASLALVIVFPVVTGSSAEFVAGTLLLIAGIFALPFALGSSVEESEAASPQVGASAAPSGGGGGLILVGPVPLFFGSWRGVSRRTRWAVALGGAALTLALILAVLLLA